MAAGRLASFLWRGRAGSQRERIRTKGEERMWRDGVGRPRPTTGAAESAPLPGFVGVQSCCTLHGLPPTQKLMQFRRPFRAETLDLADFRGGRGAQPVDATEILQQRGAALFAEAGKIVEHRLADFF